MNLLIHITKVMRRRALGDFTEAGFVARLEQLGREEFEPHGLTVAMEELENGRSRVGVKEVETGIVHLTVDFGPDGTLAVGRFDKKENKFVTGATATA